MPSAADLIHGGVYLSHLSQGERMKSVTKYFVAALAALVSVCVQAASDPSMGTWTTTLQPRDPDGNGVVDAYYDTRLNLTWLADLGSPGAMPWAEAVAWSKQFTFHGVSGWRLPQMTQGNYTEDLAGSSELGNLYFATLGNRSGDRLRNAGPFLSFGPSYWMGTEVMAMPPDRDAMYLNTVVNIVYHVDQRVSMGVTVVKAGDVLAVPEPSTTALYGIGLFTTLACCFSRRRNGSRAGKSRLASLYY